MVTKRIRTQKERRHSGWITGKSTISGMTRREIVNECLEPRLFWDDWVDYRDGLRYGNYNDRTKTPLAKQRSKIKKQYGNM